MIKIIILKISLICKPLQYIFVNAYLITICVIDCVSMNLDFKICVWSAGFIAACMPAHRILQ